MQILPLPKLTAVVAFCSALLWAHTAWAQEPDALQFFKNYFVTGGSVSGFVDLAPQSGSNQLVSGVIPMSGVPVGADLVAAFLYWETITTATAVAPVGAEFHGYDISSIAKQVATQTLTATYAPCWSSGGGPDVTKVMVTNRVDVLRFLPIGIDPTKPGYGKRLVNTADLEAHFPVGDPRRQHTIMLPDAGTGNVLPQTAGATLAVVFKDTRDDVDPAMPGNQLPPLTSVVIFDGLHLQAPGDTTKQTIKGFYQASSSNPVANLTYVAGTGAVNQNENLWFNSDVSNVSNSNQLLDDDPFVKQESPGSDRTWHTLTYPINSFITQSTTTVYGEQFDILVNHTSSTPYECLNTTAIIVDTTVQDLDNDGILDDWEAAATSGALLDPNDVALPDLYAMGARPDSKDVFVEIGRMLSAESYSNPTQITVGPHDHLLSKAALKLVGDAFKNAPVANPNPLITGIRMHFDVGAHYQDGTPYVIPFTHADHATPCSAVPAPPDTSDHTFDPDCLARGGEAIIETACVPGPLNNFTCAFPAYKGVVGYKTGYRYLRDQGVDDPATGVDESNCLLAPVSCSRRFDRNRKDIFHYALFAHALGVQRLDDPNTEGVDESVADADPNTPGFQATPVPVGVSGTGDGGGSGGGDAVVSLGFWEDFVGSDFMQASTLMHELGHNFALRHGPAYLSNNLFTVQNCQPNFQTVMNYLFQVRGVRVGEANFPIPGVQPGDAVIDYSREPLAQIIESTPGLNESTGMGTMKYVPAWYVDNQALLVADLQLLGSKRHCDGSFLSPTEYAQWSTGSGMIRVDGSTRMPPINWNMNQFSNETGVIQDVSFNGQKTSLVAGLNEWNILDLRQVGSRRNVASYAVVDAVGPLSLDQGQGDNGQGDNGQGDNGQGDNGQGDNGQGDNGQGDNGQGDNGAPPEVDSEAATDGPHLRPLTLAKKGLAVVSDWTRPHVGTPVTYEIWRSPGTVLAASKTQVGTTNAPTTTFSDSSAKAKQTYTYVIVAELTDGTRYMSNPQTITVK